MTRILLLLSFVYVFGIGAFAQSVSYYSYDKVPAQVKTSLLKAQVEKPFYSIPELKMNCKSAKNETAIAHAGLPKANKKALSATALPKQIRPSSLIICKFKKGFGAYDDFVIVDASAVAISADGLCVSNYHVFEFLLNEGQGIMPQDSLIFVADMDGNAYNITGIESYSSAADLAVFKIDTRGEKLIPAPLGNDLEVGSTVHTMTAPNQEAYYYSRGYVARNSTFGDNTWQNRCEITADYAIGSSGGPVFDDCGNLVAVVSSTSSVYAGAANERECQMVFRYTIPVSSIKRLVLD